MLWAPQPVLGPTHLPKLLEQGHRREDTPRLIWFRRTGVGHVNPIDLTQDIVLWQTLVLSGHAGLLPSYYVVRFFKLQYLHYTDCSQGINIVCSFTYPDCPQWQRWLGLHRNTSLTFRLLLLKLCAVPSGPHPEDRDSFVGFEVLTAVVMKIIIFWDITPCSPLSFNRRF
jgi:hypothetical protein